METHSIELLSNILTALITAGVGGLIISLKRFEKNNREAHDRIEHMIDVIVNTIRTPPMLRDELEEIWRLKSTYLKFTHPTLYDFLQMKVDSFIRFMEHIYRLPLYEPSKIKLDSSMFNIEMRKIKEKSMLLLGEKFTDRFTIPHEKNSREFIRKIENIIRCQENHRRERIHEEAKHFIKSFLDDAYYTYLDIEEEQNEKEENKI